MKLSTTILSATLLAGALALAGCGGSSDDQMGTDEMCPEGQVGTPPDCADPPPAGPTDLETAVDEEGKADAASAAAAMLLEDAVKDSAVKANNVNGSSQMAYDNVMAVLGTGALIEAERMKAADAVEAIKGIDTSDMSAAAMARIAGILESAEASLAEIVAIQEADGDGSLAMAVMSVRTGSAIGASGSKVAQDRANAVAKAIMGAIDATNDAVPVSAARSKAPDGKVMRAGMSGMTFKEITGSDSMAAAKLGDFTVANGTAALASLGSAGTLGQLQPAVYKGIAGNLVCLTAECEADDDGKITGNVQFVPGSATALYFQAAVGAPYTMLRNSASYGYWLDKDDAIHLHHESLSDDGSTTTLSWGRGEALEDVKASYKGDAMGYSHRTVGEGDAETTASGEFTANVTLNATFGATPALNGSVTGFSGGAHVNPAWQVTLGATETRDQNTFTGTVTSGALHGKQFATDGDWEAHGYGAAGENPTGFVGAFDAAFGDGGAAGVYHADK